MANHAYVKTRKPMTADSINQMLAKLNEELWKGLVSVECEETSWLLRYNGHDEQFWKSGDEIRAFWLDSSRCFTMRHGGGGLWVWWIDFAITNQVALQFNGRITDEGVPGKIEGIPGKYDDFKDFCYDFYRGTSFLDKILAHEMRITPSSFVFKSADSFLPT